MFIQRSWLISWPMISFGKISGTMPTPGSFVAGSMNGGSGCGRSGTMLYHCFGMSSSFSRIFRVTMVIRFPGFVVKCVSKFYLSFSVHTCTKCTFQAVETLETKN